MTRSEQILKRCGAELEAIIAEICYQDRISLANYAPDQADYDGAAFVLDGVYEPRELRAVLTEYDRPGMAQYRDAYRVIHSLLERMEEE